MREDSRTCLLLTGATGFLGKALARRLTADTRFHVLASVRRESAELVPGVQPVLVGDLKADTDWSAALSDVDVVIHAAARVHVMNDASSNPLTEFRKVNFDGTMALAKQAVKNGVKRFIFISSIKVNGEETVSGKPYTADDAPNPVDPYGVSKAETEKALLDLASSSGMQVVVVRPVLVYGPGVKANFLSLMKWLNRGVPLPLGRIENKRSLVALDNLVDLIYICIDHPAAVNQIFLVSDGDDLSTSELLQRVGKALGHPARLLPAPVGLINLLFRMIGKRSVSQRLLGSLQVDISKTRDRLNWEPPVSVEDALSVTAQDFLQQSS